MRRIWGFFLIFLTVFGATSVDVVPAVDKNFRVTGVRVEVSERQFTGDCPHRFEFTGYVTVNRPGTIRYRWLRSDGSRAPEETLVFTRPGTRVVRSDWRLGIGTRTYRDYWRSIEILAPNRLVSDRALFTLNCRPVMLVKLPTYTISGTIDAGPHGRVAEHRQARVRVTRITGDKHAAAHQVVTLDAEGRAEYRFELRDDGRYQILVERVPYTGEQGPNVCYNGVIPNYRVVELSKTNPSARDQNFTIQISIGWNRGPCW